MKNKEGKLHQSIGVSKLSRVSKVDELSLFDSVMYPLMFSLALNSLDEHHDVSAGILVMAILSEAIILLISCSLRTKNISDKYMFPL